MPKRITVEASGPLPATTPSWHARFEAKIRRDDDGCWRWTDAIGRDGYGYFGIKVGLHAYRNFMAHRLSHMLWLGPIPDGYEVDHLCRNRSCVNPAHLEAVTKRENINRGHHVNQVLHRLGVCHNGHSVNATNTVFRARTGHVVYCKVCRRESRAASKAVA